ncbi:MAG: hypothetical protein IKI37_03055, partial [Oscillospiraceae bacterium]|nr:hypothetical protein [Oscillospiraceae bacterium]
MQNFRKGGNFLKYKIFILLSIFFAVFFCSDTAIFVAGEEKLSSYATYCQLHQEADRPEQEISVKACNYDTIISDDEKQISVSDYEKKKNILVWNAPDGSVSY